MSRKKKKKPAAYSAEESRRQSLARLAERRLWMRIKQAWDKGVDPPKLRECSPLNNGEGSKKGQTLEEYVDDAGAYFKQQATLIEAYEKFLASVGQIDKSRQNPANHLGGKEYGGEASIKAYWKTGAYTIALLASINGSERVDTYYARVSPTSDEGVSVVGGMKLTKDTEFQFKKCWQFAREVLLDMSEYEYEIPVKNPYTGETETFNLDLKAFSRVLRHPESAVACSYMISEPIEVDPNAPVGFLMDELRKLENAEIKFYEILPEQLKGNGGIPEVQTPFSTNLFRSGVERKDRGCFVEIKLDISDFSMELLPLTEDPESKEWRGTRKGFAEIYSGTGGMRFLNTFLGKARANRILTPIAQAMGDLNVKGNVVPVSGGYLQYWVDYDHIPELDFRVKAAIAESGKGDAITEAERKAIIHDIVRETVENAVNRRIHSKGRPEEDKTHIDLDIEPVVSVTGCDIDVADVRARFILDSLGKDNEAVSTLQRADFLLNFFENVNKHIQTEIYEELGENGDEAITQEDLRNIQLVRWVCSRRRTVRDVEDLVWTLREDTELPEQIRSVKDSLEKWVFEFAKERYEKMFYLLAKKIEREVGK
jgi:hypothetical protein